jgi:hypothetical protein
MNNNEFVTWLKKFIGNDNLDEMNDVKAKLKLAVIQAFLENTEDVKHEKLKEKASKTKVVAVEKASSDKDVKKTETTEEMLQRLFEEIKREDDVGTLRKGFYTHRPTYPFNEPYFLIGDPIY